jgi:hypothetical protein
VVGEIENGEIENVVTLLRCCFWSSISDFSIFIVRIENVTLLFLKFNIGCGGGNWEWGKLRMGEIENVRMRMGEIENVRIENVVTLLFLKFNIWLLNLIVRSQMVEKLECHSSKKCVLRLSTL